jgi:hypothetical protein
VEFTGGEGGRLGGEGRGGSTRSRKGYGVARGMVEREEDRLLRSSTVEREAQWRARSLRQRDGARSQYRGDLSWRCGEVSFLE